MRLLPAVCQFTARALAVLGLAVALTAVCAGQATPAQQSGLAPSRFELYGGYLYVHPVNSAIGAYPYQDIVGGGLFSASYYFTKHFGVQVEGAYSPNESDDTDCWITGQAGPIARFQHGRFVPFVHVLGGAAQIGGPVHQFCDPVGYGVTGGGGLDYVLPVFHDHFAVRPVQADFTYSHIDSGAPVVDNGAGGGVGEIYALRLSAGLTFRLGHIGEGYGKDEMSLGCSVDPGESFPGQPLTASATVETLKDTRDLRYLWTTSGGVIRGDEASEPLDTRGLAPGTYNVDVHLVRGERQKAIATCMTSFVVSNPVPPTISCSADKAAINSGTPVVVTSVARSPSGRPLTYSYSATNGQVTGDGATAQLSTIGSTPGTITVLCKVSDDRGLTAQATASVVIATPAPPAQAMPTMNQLCTLQFVRDTRRPNRVDNEAKGCLDDVALNLNRDPQSKLVLVGSHGEREPAADAPERVLNAADYLVKEKGIDRGRLDLRTTTVPGQQVSTTLVPAGASFDASGGDEIDATKVRRSGQPYGMPGQRAPVKRRVRRKRRVMTAPASATTSGSATAPTHVVY